MIWLKLIWYVFWRGLVLGAIQGLLFGTLIALIYGMLYGVIIGAFLGAGLGLLNGMSFAFITRDYFYRPYRAAWYLKAIRRAAIPIDMLVVFGCSLLFVSFLAIIPAIIAGANVYYLSPGFAEYADSLMTQIPSQPTGERVIVV